jgi:hypothetical protein
LPMIRGDGSPQIPATRLHVVDLKGAKLAFA